MKLTFWSFPLCNEVVTSSGTCIERWFWTFCVKETHQKYHAISSSDEVTLYCKIFQFDLITIAAFFVSSNDTQELFKGTRRNTWVKLSRIIQDMILMMSEILTSEFWQWAIVKWIWWLPLLNITMETRQRRPFFPNKAGCFCDICVGKISLLCYGLRDINDSFFAFWETLM